MPAQLQAWLLRERALPEAVVQAAAARQTVYGGSLDTALLESGAMTEAGIWARLALATGLPAPTPAMCEGTPFNGPPSLGADATAALRACPVATDGQTVVVLCCEPVGQEAIYAAAAAAGYQAQLYVVPEARLMAARGDVYGQPVPARYARLLAQALGPRRARRAAASPSPAAAGALRGSPAMSSGASAATPEWQRGPDTKVATPKAVDEAGPLDYVLELSPAADSARSLSPPSAQSTQPMAFPLPPRSKPR